MESKKAPVGCFGKIVKWSLRGFAAFLFLLLLGFLILFRGALYNRYIAFPQETKAWEEIRASLQPVALEDGWKDFRGACHSHSQFSHDSNVPYEEILRVMKETGRDFMCISDHCHEGKADYSIQWQGIRDGVLFVPGYEMSDGLMPWGLPRDTVLDCGKTPAELAEEIEGLGGLLFIAHSEEPREWHLPQIVGMEIYNLHTDLKDENYLALAPNILMNLGAYPDLTFRLVFDRQTKILENWDELNRSRKMVGIAANDCHQNNGVVGVYKEPDTLLLLSTAPKVIDKFELNFFTKTLLRLCFGALDADKTLFHLQLDPYERMTRFVATHVLMKELSEENLLDGFKHGRIYISFDMIADATGFTFLAESGGVKGVMGDVLTWQEGAKLRAEAPAECRFTLLRDGNAVHQEEGRSVTWTTPGPGKYRLEAELMIRGEWIPWIYANPIELH